MVAHAGSLFALRGGLHHRQPLRGRSSAMNTDTAMLEAPPVAVSIRPVICVPHLYISPSHNFIGHHGGPPGTHPTTEVEQIECLAGRGIRGDRFFDYKENFKGQITFFSMEVVELLRTELKRPEAQPQAMRRNVFVRGVDLNAWIGCEFELQGVRFEGVEESKPCHWMNWALGPGAEAWLQGRAGLRCRILTDGYLRIDP